MLLDCGNIPLIIYAGIPKYNPKNEKIGPNDESYYKITINLDNKNENPKILKEQLKKIDKLTEKKKIKFYKKL